MTSMKVSRHTLDRLRPHAVFRDSWDTALNNALDMLDKFNELGETVMEKQAYMKAKNLELVVQEKKELLESESNLFDQKEKL